MPPIALALLGVGGLRADEIARQQQVREEQAKVGGLVLPCRVSCPWMTWRHSSAHAASEIGVLSAA
jgi:hypothetical protein